MPTGLCRYTTNPVQGSNDRGFGFALNTTDVNACCAPLSLQRLRKIVHPHLSEYQCRNVEREKRGKGNDLKYGSNAGSSHYNDQESRSGEANCDINENRNVERDANQVVLVL